MAWKLHVYAACAMLLWKCFNPPATLRPGPWAVQAYYKDETLLAKWTRPLHYHSTLTQEVIWDQTYSSLKESKSVLLDKARPGTAVAWEHQRNLLSDPRDARHGSRETPWVFLLFQHTHTKHISHRVTYRQFTTGWVCEVMCVCVCVRSVIERLPAPLYDVTWYPGAIYH